MTFSHPTLVQRPQPGGIRQYFWMKLIPQKLEGWGYSTMPVKQCSV